MRVDVLQLFGDLEGIEEVGDNLERAFEDREHHELLNVGNDNEDRSYSYTAFHNSLHDRHKVSLRFSDQSFLHSLPNNKLVAPVELPQLVEQLVVERVERLVVVAVAVGKQLELPSPCLPCDREFDDTSIRSVVCTTSRNLERYI